MVICNGAFLHGRERNRRQGGHHRLCRPCLDDELNTQDFTLIGVRTFTAADTVGMTKLQTQILKYRPATYFFNPL